MVTRKQIVLFILLYTGIQLIHTDFLICKDEHDFPYVGIVTTEKLRVMPERGTNYSEITTLTLNDLVTVIDQNGEWLQIKPPEQIACWINIDYVKDDVVTGHNVNLRQGPGIQYPVVGQASKGTKVVSITKENNWMKITPPESIRAWVNASFVKYFSSVTHMSSEMKKLAECSRVFDTAVLFEQAEFAKENYKEINFPGIKEKFYDIIRQYPQSVFAQKALFELINVENEQTKREAAFLEKERQLKVKALFQAADEFASNQLGSSMADTNTMINKYLEIIKTAPTAEEAKWSISRISMVMEKTSQNQEQQQINRKKAFEEAEQLRNSELLKDAVSIDYDGLINKYQYIARLYPNTPEAEKSLERINDLNTRRGPVQKKEPAGEKQLGKTYSFEGTLVKDSDQSGKVPRYRLEERGFLYKKDLCIIESADEKVPEYINKKIHVDGTLISFDDKKRPVISPFKIDMK